MIWLGILIVVCTVAVIGYLEFANHERLKWQADNFRLIRQQISDLAMETDERLRVIERDLGKLRSHIIPPDYPF